LEGQEKIYKKKGNKIRAWEGQEKLKKNKNKAINKSLGCGKERFRMCSL